MVWLIGRRVNVAALNISETLRLSVDRDGVDSGVSTGSASESESEDGGLHFECGIEELIG